MWGDFGIYFMLLCVAIMMVFPLVFSVGASLKPLDELFRLSDTLVTLYDGNITGRFKAGEITMEEIGFYMLGAKVQEGGSHE